MKRTRAYGRAGRVQARWFYSTYALDVHDRAPDKRSIWTLFYEQILRGLVPAFVEGNRFYAGFTHFDRIYVELPVCAGQGDRARFSVEHEKPGGRRCVTLPARKIRGGGRRSALFAEVAEMPRPEEALSEDDQAGRENGVADARRSVPETITGTGEQDEREIAEPSESEGPSSRVCRIE